MTHLKDVSRLKGAICGNPALQGGGASDTRHPVWKTAPQDWMSSLPASHGRGINTILKCRLSGECRPSDGLS